MSAESCPLCLSADTRPFHKGGKASGYRDFFQCGECDMVFVPRSQLLDAADQKARYLEHNNDIDDPAYRDFLGRMYYALRPHLKPRARGLDYGAGPGPALQQMMIEDGFEAYTYDIFFYPDEAILSTTYDFVTCTETAEHFDDPRREFDSLDGLMRSGGWLGVMTGMLEQWDEFPGWYYHRDPTHVNFFSKSTMQWIARHYNWGECFPRENVALFKKN